ncbi:DUF2721 domain-containing protein [Mycoplasmatota bacterium WC44]
MQLEITTPAILFPAISLLLVAYNGRYISLNDVITAKIKEYKGSPDKLVYRQIENFKKRIFLIKRMQFIGAFSFFLCVLSMITLYLKHNILGQIIFLISLIMLGISLALSLYEVKISSEALIIDLKDICDFRPSTIVKVKQLRRELNEENNTKK